MVPGPERVEPRLVRARAGVAERIPVAVLVPAQRTEPDGGRVRRRHLVTGCGFGRGSGRAYSPLRFLRPASPPNAVTGASPRAKRRAVARRVHVQCPGRRTARPWEFGRAVERAMRQMWRPFARTAAS